MKRYIKHNYGGAYDVDPQQYFTRDDLVDFSEAVLEKLYDEYNIKFDVTDLRMDDPTHLYIAVNDYSCEADCRLKLDMRTIRRPSDLMKYVDTAVAKLSYFIDR